MQNWCTIFLPVSNKSYKIFIVLLCKIMTKMSHSSLVNPSSITHFKCEYLWCHAQQSNTEANFNTLAFSGCDQTLTTSNKVFHIWSVNQAVLTNQLLRKQSCNPWQAANSVKKCLWQVGQHIWPHTHFFHQSIRSGEGWQGSKEHPSLKFLFDIDY